MKNQKNAWDQSYKNGDNNVFYPHEEIIRFFSKYIRKKININIFKDIYSFNEIPKLLDLGCGIGRHIIYAYENGLDAYGIDLSEVAINYAQEWANLKGMNNSVDKIVQGDIRNLPWDKNFFDIIISHAVLDSMHFTLSKEAVIEVSRVLKPGGLFYCDLISMENGVNNDQSFDGEELVNTAFEKNTIQSYFTLPKIKELISDRFEILDCKLIVHHDNLRKIHHSRYHLILRNCKNFNDSL